MFLEGFEIRGRAEDAYLRSDWERAGKAVHKSVYVKERKYQKKTCINQDALSQAEQKHHLSK